MLRTNLLFIHVISALALATALGIEAVALNQLRRVTDGASARAALATLDASRRVGGLGVLLLLLSGLGLASAYWHWKGAWIGLGLAGMVGIGAMAGVMTGRRVSLLRRRLGEGALGSALTEALPALRASFVIRGALLAGIVYLMTVKPGPLVSLGALGIAVIAGLILGRARTSAAPLQATRAQG